MNLFVTNRKSASLAHLIDLFMAGETSVAQERELFAAFAPGRNVPHELERYRQMMQWYASLSSDNGEVEVAVPRRRLPRVAVWVSAAAAVAALITVGIGYMSNPLQPDDDYVLYRGSYVIRNGHKVTDLAQILSEVKRVEQIVSSQQAAVAKAVEVSDPSSEAGIYDFVDMDDPVVRDVMQRVLSE